MWNLSLISEFLSAVGDRYGFDYEGSLTGDKSVSALFDNAKIKRLAPEMTTHIPFHIGVRRALAYILAHPEEYMEDPEFDAWCDKVIDTLEKAKEAI